MDFTLEARRIESAVRDAKQILLVGHQRPDYDALGSISAFGGWLDQLGKPYHAYCPELPAENPEDFFIDRQRFLPTLDADRLAQFDTVIVLDTGDQKYAGIDQLLPKLANAPLLVNIDHHLTNQLYGAVNLVDSLAASTTEILFQIFRQLKVKVTALMANSLLAGILNDTYHFTNPNTAFRTLEVAAQLLRAGARLPAVSEMVRPSKSLAELRLWGKVLSRLSRNPESKMAVAVISDEDLVDPDLTPEAAEGIANFLNGLSDVDVSLVLRQMPDQKVKGSFRTNSELIDVAKLATMLGGGGHRKAAGFTVPGVLKPQQDGGWKIE